LHKTPLQKQKATKWWFKQNWQLMFHNETPKGEKNKVWSYTIFSDSASNVNDHKFDAVPTPDEVAQDPQNPKLKMGYCSKLGNKNNPAFNLTKTFGVNNVEFSGWVMGTSASAPTFPLPIQKKVKGCNRRDSGKGSKRILFDNFGRAYNGFNKDSTLSNPYEVLNKMTETCLITLTKGDKKSYICINSATGLTRRVETEKECKPIHPHLYLFPEIMDFPDFQGLPDD